jgi:hypothetical protein
VRAWSRFEFLAALLRHGAFDEILLLAATRRGMASALAVHDKIRFVAETDLPGLAAQRSLTLTTPDSRSTV